MAHEIFRHTHRVTYADCTVGNHVYYSRFLELLETARGEFFRHLGAKFLRWQQAGLAFPVVECRLQYKALARYDDALSVGVWMTRMERIRLNFAYRIVNQDQKLILEAATDHICVSLDEKPRRLPEDLVKKLQPYLAGDAPPASAGVAATPSRHV